MNNIINENFESSAASLLQTTNKFCRNINATKEIKNILISPKG